MFQQADGQEVKTYVGGSVAEATLKNLSSKASSLRKRRSIDIVWRALGELHAEGAPDFSISRVGARSEKLGGPKTQSLRNEGGEDYRELISAFARDVGREMRPKELRPASQLDEAIGRIPDLAVRTLIRLKLEDAKRLKTENDTLRMAFRELSVDATGIKVDSDENEVEAAYQVQEGICLVGSEIAAIQRFTSEDWFAERGWVEEADGSVCESNRRDSVVAPPGFMHAVRRLIA